MNTASDKMLRQLLRVHMNRTFSVISWNQKLRRKAKALRVAMRIGSVSTTPVLK